MISPMSPERVGGIARYAKEHSWNLMIQDRLGHSPLTWQGDGILATIRSDPDSRHATAALLKRGIPIVDLTISRPEIKLPRVVSDHAAIGRLAAEHFAERKFRHIAWFSFGWGHVHRLRYEGLVAAWGNDVPAWRVPSNLLKSGWNGFVAWISARLANAPKPLAVLTYNEADAARLLYATRELNINVPEELAILSVGNNALICENQSVPLSSIDQNLEEGGYQAAALLDRIMDANHTARDIPLVTIPPRGIISRRSTDVVAVDDPIVHAALVFIVEHLGEPIGSPQIADALNVRRADLDHRFRTVLNRPVGDEIRQQRLLRVRRLLTETRLPIAAIAAETGYCTPSHLTNAFKLAFGISPKDFRASKAKT